MLLGAEHGALTNRSRGNEAEGPKHLGRSGNHAQLWACLVVRVKSGAVKSNVA